MSQGQRSEVFFRETRKWKETVEDTYSECQFQVRNQGQLQKDKHTKENVIKMKKIGTG